MKRASKWLWMGLAIAVVLACFVPFASSLLGPMRGIVGLLAVLLLLFVVRSFAVGKEKDKLLTCLEENRWLTTQQVFERMQRKSPACSYEGVQRLLTQLYRQKKIEQLVQPDAMGERAHHWRLPSRAPEDAIPRPPTQA